MASRIGTQGAEPALRQFAKEISDPVGDHVAVALIVRHRHGGVGLADVLAQLAGDVDEQVRMRRDILAEQSERIERPAQDPGRHGRRVGAADPVRPHLHGPVQPARRSAGPGGHRCGFGLTLWWFVPRLAPPVLGARFLEDLPPAEPDNSSLGYRPVGGPR